jgi:hypothetical protein
VTSGETVDALAEAVLMRKKPFQKRPSVVMRGRVEQLVRYVLSTPTAHHKEYRLVCGGKEYGLGRVEALARDLKVDTSAQDSDKSETPR